MRVDAQAPTIRLADYRPPAFLAETVDLSFTLAPTATRVRARIGFRRNPARAGEGPLDLRLDGRQLRLVSAAIGGAAVPQNALAVDDEGLTVAGGRWCRRTRASSGRRRPRSRRRATPRSRGSTCRGPCTAPSARRRGSARSPSIRTGRT